MSSSTKIPCTIILQYVCKRLESRRTTDYFSFSIFFHPSPPPYWFHCPNRILQGLFSLKGKQLQYLWHISMLSMSKTMTVQAFCDIWRKTGRGEGFTGWRQDVTHLIINCRGIGHEKWDHWHLSRSNTLKMAEWHLMQRILFIRPGKTSSALQACSMLLSKWCRTMVNDQWSCLILLL